MVEDDCFEGLYHFLKVLGEGSFGKAVLYRRYTDNFLVVWKEVKLKSDKDILAAQHEVDVLSLLSHRNIIGYYNNYVDADVMYIEMEYANGGTLLQLINNQNELFAEEEVIWYFYQLCSACVYLHDHGIIHRDIKTMNIFLNKTGILKVGDFGISKILTSESDVADSIVGTPYYMSPEICRGLPYGYKSDVWSCGCVLYEMLELRKTFDATNQLRLVYSIVTKEAKPVSEHWTQDLRNILSSMLQKDPENRPSMKQLLDTCYMKSVESAIEDRLGPQNYVRGLSQLAPGTQPMLTNLSSEVYIWGGGKTTPQTLTIFKKDLGAVKVCVGPKHLCVVTVEKELYTWSSGQPGEIVGQLGHGDKASYRAPKQVAALLGSGVVDVIAGDDFTIAVLEENQLVGFGSNYDGCLGIGEEYENSLVPVIMEFFSDKRVVSISCGECHVMAVTDAGEIFGWGNGEYGCLGNDSEDIIYIPQRLSIRGAKAGKVICGKHCSFIITIAGKLMASGDNQDNKLGINKIGRAGVKIAKSEETFTFKPVYGLSTVAVREVTCGVDHTAVIDAYDRLWTMGSNKCGQRGLGHYKPFSHPNIVKAKLSGKKIALVSTGDRFTVATTYDNEVYSWGYRNHGRLGDGQTSQMSGNTAKNSTCLPHPIFSSLHYIPALSSRHWYTLLVAEQVISAQVIGSGEQGLRQYSSDSGRTPTWIHEEMEIGETPASQKQLLGGKIFHNEISLKNSETSSGISSANTADISQTPSSSASYSDLKSSGSDASNVGSCATSDEQRRPPPEVTKPPPEVTRPPPEVTRPPPEVTRPPPESSRQESKPPSSPPPVFRPEFSFDKTKYGVSKENSVGTSSESRGSEPTPTPQGEACGSEPPDPQQSDQVLSDRVRDLERELELEKQKVRERDKKIAELEQQLLDIQISEMKGLL